MHNETNNNCKGNITPTKTQQGTQMENMNKTTQKETGNKHKQEEHETNKP